MNRYTYSHFDDSEILVTTGGSEALQIALNCILDDGDEIIIPEPFYPNYNTFVRTTGASIRPLTTRPEEGYHYADRSKIEPLINEHTRAIMVTNPGNPTRRCPDAGGDADAGGCGQGARPLRHRRRGVPRICLRRGETGLHGPV